MAKLLSQSQGLDQTSRWKAEDKTLQMLTMMDCGNNLVSTREQRCVKVDKEGQSSAELGWGYLWRREGPEPAAGNLSLRRRNIRRRRQQPTLVSPSESPVSKGMPSSFRGTYRALRLGLFFLLFPSWIGMSNDSAVAGMCFQLWLQSVEKGTGSLFL